jgi:hypothetical protein
MAGLKVMIMSFIERAMSLAEQFDPLWVLPAWLRTMIMSTVQFFLAVGSVVALVLYRNQVAILTCRRVAVAGGMNCISRSSCTSR